jgi:hypothetical protein
MVRWTRPRSTFFYLLPVALFSAGCSGDDVEQRSSENAPPIAAVVQGTTQESQPEVGATGDQALGSTLRPHESELRRLTPELRQAFELSEQISDHADSDFERSLTTLEHNASEHTQRLRFLLSSPEASAPLRSKAVYLLGRIGSGADVPLLVQLGNEPAPYRLRHGDDAHGDHDVDDEPAALRWHAVFALAAMARRSNAAAIDGLRQLIATADQDIATAAAVELTEQSLLDATARGQLRRRGLSDTFQRLNPEDVFRIPEADTLYQAPGKPEKAARPLPPAAQ